MHILYTVLYTFSKVFGKENLFDNQASLIRDRIDGSFKIRNNRPQRLASPPWPIFLCIESTIWGPKSVPIKRAAKTIMLHSCDIENCEDTPATIYGGERKFRKNDE